jgi:hypothetical protein
MTNTAKQTATTKISYCVEFLTGPLAGTSAWKSTYQSAGGNIAVGIFLAKLNAITKSHPATDANGSRYRICGIKCEDIIAPTL